MSTLELSKKVPLSEEIDIGGMKVKHLTVRRPRVRDRLNAVRAAPNASNEEQEVHLFAFLCEVTTDVIEGLLFDDYNAIGEAVQGFQPSQASKN